MSGLGDGMRVLRLALPPFIAAKLTSVLVALVSVWGTSRALGFPSYADFRAGFAQWDGQWYTRIAEQGYPSHLDFAPNQGAFLYAFLPGYPLLIRAVMAPVPDSVLAAGLVSAVTELVALFYVIKLVSLERDPESGSFVAWCVAFYPFAFVLTAAYTESPFLAAAAAALYYSRTGDTRRATVAAFCAGAIRVHGLALVAAFIIRPLRERTLGATMAALPPIVAAVAPLLLFCVYAQLHSGDFLVYFHAQSSPSFGHHLDWPWSGLQATLQAAFTGESAASNTWIFFREVLFGVAGLVVVIACWVHPRFPASLAAYCTAIWLVSVSVSVWLSVPRYEIAMFPALIILADLFATREHLRTGWIAVSGGFMAYGASLFATGQWLS